jgi:hypothetical protein
VKARIPDISPSSVSCWRTICALGGDARRRTDARASVWQIATAILALVVILAGSERLDISAAGGARRLALFHPPPEGGEFQRPLDVWARIRGFPDGRRIVFSAADASGNRQLVDPRGRFSTALPLPGTMVERGLTGHQTVGKLPTP